MAAPLSINKRPFSVEPLTGLMLPDGFCDIAIRRQLLSVFLRNDSTETIRHFWGRIADDVDVTVIGERMFYVRNPLPPGTSTLLQWEVTFRGATPGKKDLRVELGGASDLASGVIQHWDGFTEPAVYFLSSTTYDPATRLYLCEVPEGHMTVEFQNSSQATVEQRLWMEAPLEPIQFPERFRATVRGDGLKIPFEDPWWKVVAWLIAALASIGAIIAARNGQGAVMIGVSGHGHDDPTQFDWCIPDPGELPGEHAMTPAGILSAIANGAILVALADDEDPWERGRNAANLAAGEFPMEEVLDVQLRHPEIMEAGALFSVGVDWTYRALLNTGRETSLKVSETRTNEHVANWVIDAPEKALASGPIVVKLQGMRRDGRVFNGDELYGYALFITPDGESAFRIPLGDGGQGYDNVAGDGWFSAGIHIETLLGQGHQFEPAGEWTVRYLVQDVNDATPTMPPKEAATHVGGAPVLASTAASKSNDHCTISKYSKIVVGWF